VDPIRSDARKYTAAFILVIVLVLGLFELLARSGGR
jgi:hypothetical protein